MAGIITVPQQIGTYKGCTMFRQLCSRDRDISFGLGTPIIQVIYDQWLVTPTGDEVERVNRRCYFVRNVPAISLIEGQDVYDENRILLTQDRPAYNGFDIWRGYNVGALPDGTTLEQVIIGSINATLLLIPMDAVDGYVRVP